LERKSVKYRFFETAGLAEVIKNQEDEDYKISLLDQLLNFAVYPIDLIIFVTRSGTIHFDTQDMYALVVDIMPKTIPIVCVVTGCENEWDMNRWAQANEPHFTRNHMMFQQILGTCFGHGGRFETVFGPLRKESSTHLWNSIESLLVDDVATSGIRSTEISRNHAASANQQTQIDANDVCNGTSNGYRHRLFKRFRDMPSKLSSCVAQQTNTDSPHSGGSSPRNPLNPYRLMLNIKFKIGFDEWV
jgi:hypothetical protein